MVNLIANPACPNRRPSWRFGVKKSHRVIGAFIIPLSPFNHCFRKHLIRGAGVLLGSMLDSTSCGSGIACYRRYTIGRYINAQLGEFGYVNPTMKNIVSANRQSVSMLPSFVVNVVVIVLRNLRKYQV